MAKKSFTCVAPSDYKGVVVQPGVTVTVSVVKGKTILDDHPSWEEVKPVKKTAAVKKEDTDSIV